jgi:hypothetical protein
LKLADAYKKVLEKRGISPFKDNRKQLLQWKVRDGKSSMKDDDFYTIGIEMMRKDMLQARNNE